MTVKKNIKSLFSSLGYKIEKANNPNPLTPRYSQLIKEIHGSYRDLKFPELNTLEAKDIELLSSLDGTQISEAIYILQAICKTNSLPGDVCEFGVAQGFTSALLGHNILQTKKNLWLFDSFEGLPAPTAKDKLKDDIFGLKKMEAYQGTMKHKMDSVMSNLKNVGFPENRIRIVDGFIEKTILTSQLPKQVSFAYIDFDFYNPIKIALEFMDKVLEKGGVVIVDDYDFFSEGAKVAVDEFYESNNDRYVLEMPIPSAGHFAILKKIN